MDIQARKLELIKLLLDTQSVEIVLRIQEIFEQEENKDFWDQLHADDQLAIKEGITQLNEGKHVSLENVNTEIKRRLKF